jgi:predicted ATP-grasp superfamily ATP-dependent carboligase
VGWGDAAWEAELLQRFVVGDLASACFVADGRRARLLGLTRQYAGESGLGAPSFAWCGNVAPWGGPELEAIIERAVNALVQGCGLRGLNGIDFIVQEGVSWLLEVNPRPPASFELFERLLDVNAFQLHVDSCEGRLPDPPGKVCGAAWGKGILYAREDLTVGDTRSWSQQGAADIPHPGEQIPSGAPICTLFAQGKDAADCWQRVLDKAHGWRLE